MHSVKHFEQYFSIHEFFNDLYKYNKTVVFIKVGNFYELYSYDKNGPDIFKIICTLNISYTLNNKNKILSKENPYTTGFSIKSTGEFSDILKNNDWISICMSHEYDIVKDKYINFKIDKIIFPDNFNKNLYSGIEIDDKIGLFLKSLEEDFKNNTVTINSMNL